MSVVEMCPWCGEYRVIRGVRVLHVNLTPNAAFEQAAFELLDASERSRLGRFRAARPRTQYSLCRAALRLALCKAIGCSNRELSFEFREHGKPFARVGGNEAAIRFNVSHSQKHGLIAVGGEGRLGIDAEVREERRDLVGISEAVYGPNERAAIKRATGEDRTVLFYRLWAMKEALIKALGTGFSLNPSRFEVPAEMLEGALSGTFRFPHVPGVQWHLQDLSEERFAAAIAFEIRAQSRPKAPC